MTKVSPLNARIQAARTDGSIHRDLQRVLDEVRTRTGGGDDAIEETKLGEVYEPGVADSRIKQLQQRIADLEIELSMMAPLAGEVSALRKRVADLETDVATDVESDPFSPRKVKSP